MFLKKYISKILISLVFVLSTNLYATPVDFCKSVGGLAKEIFEIRQMGGDREELEEFTRNMNRSVKFHEIADDLIERAFSFDIAEANVRGAKATGFSIGAEMRCLSSFAN